MSPTVRLDLHVHSRHSPDARPSVAEIAVRAEALDLAGFALTDHNSVAGHAELPAIRARFPRLIVVPGVEVSTREGHLLAYGIADAPPRDRPVAETVAWVRARGGVPVLAHPYRVWHGAGRRAGATVDVAAIESLNGHSSARVNRRASGLAATRGVGTTGGSDAHDVADVGRCWTELELPSGTVDDVLAALGRGAVRGAGRSASRSESAGLALRSAGRRLRRGLRAV